MRYIIAFFISCLILNPAIAQEQVQEQSGNPVEVLLEDDTFNTSVVGICARTLDGRSIVKKNSEQLMVPASNMKLLTTAAAFNRFGGDFRFETSIAYDGEIIDGVLHGDLYIVGGGDPTTAAKDSIATGLWRQFAQWKAILKDAGITKIDGHIVGDGRCYEEMAEYGNWLYSDIGTYYGTGVTGLMFYTNMQSFNVSAGQNVGDPVNISPSYPETPWMSWRYECCTGEKDTGDRLYLYTTSDTNVGVIRGTFGVNRQAKRLDCSNKFPEYTCATYFYNSLKESGIECTKGATDFKFSQVSGKEFIGVPQDSLRKIGGTFSPELRRIAFTTNYESNNVYADALFKALGKADGNDSFENSAVSLENELVSLGLQTAGRIKIADGSGLSRQNYVSTGFFCDFLEKISNKEWFEDFLATLPSPGDNGSLMYNMKGYSETTRHRIKMKSGSMNGVRCYSGYILPTSGKQEDVIVFSIMVNNCTSPNWKVRPLMDKIIATLATYKVK